MRAIVYSHPEPESVRRLISSGNLNRDAKLARLRSDSVAATKDPWTCARGLDAMLAAMG